MADERPPGNSGTSWRAPQSTTPGTPPPGATQPGPSKRGSRWPLIIGLIVLLGLLAMGALMVLVVGTLMLSLTGHEEGWGGLGAKVGVITVSGVISSTPQNTLFLGEVGGSQSTMAQLRAAAKDESVKAVVLRINSPGGSAAASEAILEEVKKLADKKPVVASMGDVAASGGYYIACGANKIVANPGTITGSIGVIMSTLTYTGLMDKVGIGSETRTSGPYKDTGSPWREMREDERKLLQTIVEDVYNRFVEDVAAGRGMTEAEVRKLADGRVMTGQQAKEAKLVDKLGNFHDAIELAAEMGKIKGEPKLKCYGARGGLRELLGTYMESERQRAMRDFLLLYDQRLQNVDEMLQLQGGQ